ncbi:VWDE [Branchiostoma lanceolatum]|uniref:VWDE protein n=1 Tax=Branchiostoma lanceolatum TaxID=7740 RepID=A0A8J9WGB3_BRALA|nr:VWDE [Branchiostoma lanceolatum]
MADIQVTEDLSYALSAADEIKEECSETAYQNTTLYETNEVGIAVPPTIITSQLCPRQCSQRGECVNGTCQCTEGFTSADCSMQVGRAPQALFLPVKGLCDIRHRPCMKATFIADGLIDSENLTCRVTQVSTHDGTRQVQQDTTGQTEGRMLSSGEVRCHLPRSPVALGTPAEREGAVTHGMMLSVSNDGQRFSQELLFTVYDSVCQECFEGVNQAPRFNSPPTITKVAGENLTITIGAVDPEDIDECVLTNHGCEYQCANTPGGYGCACPEGHVVAADESLAFTGEITLTIVNGNEVVFTEEGLGTPGSQEFIEMATLLDEAIIALLHTGSLQDKFVGCKVKAFRQGSVIAEFDVYFVEDADLSSSEVMDAILNDLTNNTLSGENGVIVVIPSSLQVSSQATPATGQMWYNSPLYLSLLCVGCAVVVTVLIVGAVCLLTSPNRRRKMVISDSTVDINMADMNGKAEGIDGPAAEDDKY